MKSDMVAIIAPKKLAKAALRMPSGAAILMDYWGGLQETADNGRLRTKSGRALYAGFRPTNGSALAIAATRIRNILIKCFQSPSSPHLSRYSLGACCLY